MNRFFLSAMLIALLLPPAYANTCEEADDQASMTECVEQAYQASDAELNELYRQIEHRLGDDEDTKNLLLGAERAWVSFRDAECTFASSAAAGGSAEPMARAMCLGALTQTRIDELEQYLACEEGDLSCPVPPAD
ncbi:lysozyme inhibitor LprI family protein [Pelagibacterium limicola]|uniref:lysozyme inhibitor LprI family protein n=1 Tax=Pelagibacterium limicola TaxID=2791022 RepID=UPI0018AF5638|nr:lysozyme inhibitor LprI family protein [Pelagibacterium limicola]